MTLLVTDPKVRLHERHLSMLASHDVRAVWVDGTDHGALLAYAGFADAVMVMSERIDEPLLERLVRCRVVTRLGIGTDTVDVPAATKRGVWVTNVPDGNFREVAVHAIMLILALTRGLPEAQRSLIRTGWTDGIAFGDLRRPEMQTLGLLGMGRIGRRVAEIASVIGFRVAVCDPRVSDADAKSVGARALDFDSLIASSDVLSLHVPLMDTTRRIIGRDVLERMPRRSFLINVSRGGLVDEEALVNAIRLGHLAGAGLDAYETEPLPSTSPLRELRQVILTPHTAAHSREAGDEIFDKAIADICRVLTGMAPHYTVNDPASPRMTP